MTPLALPSRCFSPTGTGATPAPRNDEAWANAGAVALRTEAQFTQTVAQETPPTPTVNRIVVDASLLSPSPVATESNVKRRSVRHKRSSLLSQSPLVWQIVGTNNDVLAYYKFATFALVASLLVSDAAKRFRQALKVERDARRAKRLFARLLVRDARQKKQFNKRLNKLVLALLRTLNPKLQWGEDERHCDVCEVDGRATNVSCHGTPCWTGEPRPTGYRTATLRSRYPSPTYVESLVKQGYDAHAAVATLARGHQPWTRPVPDRRQRQQCEGADKQAEWAAKGYTPNEYEAVSSPNHPYYPMAPSRRTHVGGGLTKAQVEAGLTKMRTDAKTKRALFEIVYRRRSPLQVSDETGLRVENLNRYASRLRVHIRTNEQVDLNDTENVA